MTEIKTEPDIDLYGDEELIDTDAGVCCCLKPDKLLGISAPFLPLASPVKYLT